MRELAVKFVLFYIFYITYKLTSFEALVCLIAAEHTVNQHLNRTKER